jgi:hypothetical protein
LRQQVLEDRGWIIHRIWSTDWFRKPQERLRKVAEAIERAKVVWSERIAGESPEDAGDPPGPPVILRHEVDQEDGDAEPAIASVPYVEASFSVDLSRAVHELTAIELARVVKRIVEIEGPVHQDEIVKRTATLWQLQRAGSRVRDAVESALCEAKDRGWVVQDEDFFSPAKREEVEIRSRDEVQSASLRTPAMLPPSEVRTVVLAVVQAHVGVSDYEIVSQVARLLGFKTAAAALRQTIQSHTAALVEIGRLELRNGRYSVSDGQALRIKV